MVVPAVRAAVERTKNGRIGLIGTAASIRSGAYEREIAALDPGIQVFAKACPLFVPLVENGRFRPGDQVVELVAGEYLGAVREQGVDTLVLGCTHYPLLADVIRETMAPGTVLIDTGAACAQTVAEDLKGRDALAGREHGGCRYFVSDSTADFTKLASVFLGEAVTEPVERVAIEGYSAETPAR